MLKLPESFEIDMELWYYVTSGVEEYVSKAYMGNPGLRNSSSPAMASVAAETRVLHTLKRGSSAVFGTREETANMRVSKAATLIPCMAEDVAGTARCGTGQETTIVPKLAKEDHYA